MVNVIRLSEFILSAVAKTALVLLFKGSNSRYEDRYRV